MLITPEQRKAVLELYDSGRFVDAYTLATSFAPLREWRGPGARTLAGRVAFNVGAPQLGYVLHRLAFREDPLDPETMYYHGRLLLDRRGPVFAWEFLQTDHELERATPDQRADWFSLHALALALLRDFETAEQWLARAEALAPDKPWICCERAELLERQDRYKEALAATRRALEIRPWYRPAVHTAAHLLQLLGRDDKALGFLTEAVRHMQSSAVIGQLAVAQTEVGQYEAARASWEKVVELSPALEKEFGEYLAARRSDAAYYCGDWRRAIELAKESDNKFHKDMAAKLEASQGQGKRVMLPVTFVRQHHHTCAPATLSALSRFWNKPAEHLEVAEEICYDGTPAHSERNWATTSGYVAREFTITWDSVLALIDRGIPFTLTTVETTTAHLQACIGYDSIRGTLLIRDPYMRMFGEFVAEPFFERYRLSGPRGMVMVPKEDAHKLEGIELPEADLYDLFHEVQSALVAHRRTDADKAYAALADRAPNGRLTLTARRSLAAYDQNHVEGLTAVEALMALYPDEPSLVLSKLSHLRTLGRREQRIELLNAACETFNTKEKKGFDPVYWYQLAQELKDDAREHPAAIRLLRRALRYTRSDAGNYFILAGILWDDRRFEESLRLYRFATTLEDKHDVLAQSYFSAARHMKQTGEAMRLLRDRFQRFGRRSARPASVLFWAYEEIHQDVEAFKVLDEALTWRPDDGELLLLAANAYARHGNFDKASAHLDRAKDKTRPAAWLRGAAEIASYRGDADEGKKLWRQVIEAEPLALDAHRHLAHLLASTEGPEAAVAHLREVCERFPHNYPLHQLWIDYIRDEGPEAAAVVVQKLLDIHPSDAWARRELVWNHIVSERLDAALEEAGTVLRLDPTNPSSHYCHGKTLEALGRWQEARDAYRRGVELSVDADFCIGALIGVCHTPAERKAELAFVREELVKQTIFGDGLLAYMSVAQDNLEPEELLAALRQAQEARPDLWHGWAAVARQLANLDRLNEAQQVLNQAAERFPLLPRLWFDLAHVYRLMNDDDAEVAALEQALAISPGWGVAVRQLAEVYDRRGEFDRARTILESAIAKSPLDEQNYGGLADVLFKQGEIDAAFERLAHAVRVEPGYTWAWDTLHRWSNETGRDDMALTMARELTQTRAGEARSWLILARLLTEPAEMPERLAAIEKAIELSPRTIDAHEQRGRLLADLGRFDEALAACRPAVFGERIPLELRARAAWITARRGDLADAIRQMREILADEPGFFWGWGQLCLWSKMNGDKAGFLEAAETMARNWPHDPGGLAQLGEARLMHEDRAGAKAAFGRALEIAPDYEYVASFLFDMQLEDSELGDAAVTLDLLRQQSPGARTRTREVQLAAKRDDRDAALRGLSALALMPMPDDDPWPIRAAYHAAIDAGWAAEAEQALLDAAARPEANPVIGEYLVQQYANSRGPDKVSEIVQRLEGCGPVAIIALRAWVRVLAEAAQAEMDRKTDGAVDTLKGMVRFSPARPLRRLVRERREQLRSDTQLWGTVGYAMQTIRDYKSVVEWMHDWRDRPEAEGWMLVNLAEAMRARGNDAEAREVSRRALETTNDDQPRGIHLLWTAADAVLDGEPQMARDLLSVEADRTQGEQYVFLRRMVEATVDVRLAPPASRAATFREVRKRIAQACRDYRHFTKDRELRRLFRKCVRRIAKDAAGVRGRLWALGQMLSK